MENSGATIVVNGVSMSAADWKKSKEKQGKKPMKKRTQVSSARELGDVSQEVESMIKGLTQLKSLVAYHDHAYRQWGTIANEIFSIKGIHTNLCKIAIATREIDELLQKIQKFSKLGEKSVFQYLEKLSWKFDDVKTAIRSLNKYVRESSVCQRFKGHECINGQGRRLGLQTIINNSYKTLDKLEDGINRLNKIAKDGVGAFEEECHMSFKEKRKLGL